MTPIDALAQAGSFEHLFTEHPGRMPFSCTSTGGAPASFFDRGTRDRNAHGTLAMQRFQPLLAEAVFHVASVCMDRFAVERHRVDVDLSLRLETPDGGFTWTVGATIWDGSGKPLATPSFRASSPSDAIQGFLNGLDATLPTP
jgi:hypothetical protein